MPNPTATKLAETDTTVTVVCGRWSYVFPKNAAGLWLAQPTPPAEAPSPGNGMPSQWLASQAPVAGGTITLPPGVETGALHIGVPQTIIGAGMRSTVLDGEYGNGAGHRLAWQKGIVHIGAPVQIRNVGLKRGGKGDGKSDAEAAVYVEWTGDRGPVLLELLAIDDSENGVFMPGLIEIDGRMVQLAEVDLIISKCVFGRLAPNGLEDGKSHNVYLGGRSVLIKDSVLFGSLSNTIKVRGPKFDMIGTHVERLRNRWLDFPAHTIATSTRNTYVTPPGVDVQNAMGFFDEADTASAPGQIGSFTSTDDTFYFSRWNEVIWINHPDIKVEFIRPKVFWIGAKGAQPPRVTIQGPGKLTGADPFVFNESNRVDAAPAAPADPT